MAIWSKSLSTAIPLAEAIFNSRDIECKAEFWFLPHLYKWEGYFKTGFRYLHLDARIDLPLNYTDSYNSFVKEIETIRNEIMREFDLYFNELWC